MPTNKQATHDLPGLLKKISTAAAEAVTTVRDLGLLTEIGDFCRQGDIYIIRVTANHPRGKAISERQLVQGTSLGSRHVLEGPWKIFAPRVERELDGPVIQPMGDDAYITHPTHALCRGVQGHHYAITFQEDAARRRRVQD
jgi:hypothetical protein